MLTIGDVLAIIGGIVMISGSVWAMLIGVALLFEDRSAGAEACLERAPIKMLGLGAVLSFAVGFLAVALLGQPSGPGKLLGWALLLVLLLLSAVGASGLARLVGRRVGAAEPGLTALSALARGAALPVVAGLVPFLGWFVIAPAALLISLGAGVSVTFRRKRKVEGMIPQENAEARS